MIDSSADTEAQSPTDEINNPLPGADADWTTSRQKRLLGKTVEIQGAGASGISRNANRGTPIDFGFLPFQPAPQESCSSGHAAPGNYAIQRVESLTEERVRMLGHIHTLERLVRERTWDLTRTKVMLEDKTEQFEIRSRENEALLHQGDELRKMIATLREDIKQTEAAATITIDNVKAAHIACHKDWLARGKEIDRLKRLQRIAGRKRS